MLLGKLHYLLSLTLAEAIRSGTLEGIAEWAASHRAVASQENEEPQAQAEHER